MVARTRAEGPPILRTSRLILLLLLVTFANAVSLVWPISSPADNGRHAGPGARPDTRPRLRLRTPFRFCGRRRRSRGTCGSSARLPPSGERVVGFAKHLIGVHYSWGGSSPRTGFDCSGFVRYVYGHFGVSLAHSSFADFWRGRKIGRWALKPGDLVFFDGEGHVGIYVGHGRFIHAPHTGTVVRISTMSGWYASRFDGARRLVANS